MERKLQCFSWIDLRKLVSEKEGLEQRLTYYLFRILSRRKPTFTEAMVENQ